MPSNQVPTTPTATTTSRTKAASLETALQENLVGQEKLEVIEESLQVGKREVDRGGVRVESRVVAQPVTEQVALREEHVQVERHAVNRPVSPGDPNAFREGVIEMRERGEEAVVAKQARVVEEIVLGKNVEQRVEQVNETIRHMEVSVDRFGGRADQSRFRSFDAYDSDFRSNFESTYARTGGTYDNYAPLYRYGYGLATADRFAGKDWSSVEGEARTAWEERNPGTWDQVKAAVRHAWDRVTAKL